MMLLVFLMLSHLPSKHFKKQNEEQSNQGKALKVEKQAGMENQICPCDQENE